MPGVTIGAVIVFVLLAALVVPIVIAELNRRPRRRQVSKPPVVPKRESATKPPLRLVVDKNDMDRELAALLAKDSRKSSERDD